MKKFALIAVSIFAIATLASAQMNMSQDKPAQDKSKRPSPPASAECKFSDGKTVKVDYSSPRAKGRKIFGVASEKALVPYGEIWRTGANDATTFVTDTNVAGGGKGVPGGSYNNFTMSKAGQGAHIGQKKSPGRGHSV